MFTVTSILVISCLQFYRTSLQIFLFCKLFCTNISQVELEILRNSSSIFRYTHRRCSNIPRVKLEILRNFATIVRSSHWRYSRKKAILKHFVIFTGKHLCWGLFLNKVAGHKACKFIKKRLQHRYFLVNIGKSVRRPNANGCIFGKCFVRKFFRSELGKRNY